MYNKLGVIPAGGNGVRWGGFAKEMLPLDDGTWLIDHTCKAMIQGGADALLVVTNERKLLPFATHLQRHDVPIFYALTPGDKDIWNAFEVSFAYPADMYLYAMPDTLYPDDAFEVYFDVPFSLGVHRTDEPERFGMLRDGQVINKQPGKPGWAWGLLAWSAAVVEFWQDIDDYTDYTKSTEYTDGINQAIQQFGLHTWPIKYYHDMASFADYQRWLCQ